MPSTRNTYFVKDELMKKVKYKKPNTEMSELQTLVKNSKLKEIKYNDFMSSITQN